MLSSTALCPDQLCGPPVDISVISLEVMRPGPQTYDSSPSSDEVTNALSMHPVPPMHWRGA